MLAVAPETVQAVDLGVLLLGAGVAAALICVLFRSAAWRNPLRGRAVPGSSEHAWLATAGGLLAYLFGTQLAALLLLPAGADEDVRRPGTHAWHLAQASDAVGKLAACLLMAAALIAEAQRRPALASRPRLGVLAGVVFGGALATTFVTVLLLYAGKLAWQWWQPDVVQPVHPVLTALKESAWNAPPAALPWGTIQLWVAALLIAPVSEELFFRGVLLAGLHRTFGHTWLAIALSAALFGFIHGSQPQDILPLAVFGVVLGFVRVRWGSLPACMLIHCLFNLRTMVQATLAPELIDA